MTHMSREEVSHIVADLEHRFIAHDTYLELRDQIDDILYRRKAHTAAGRVTAQRGIVVIGNAGAGKSFGIEHLLQKHPHVAYGKPYNQALTVRLASEATIKGVGLDTLEAYGYESKGARTGHSIWRQVMRQARSHKTLFLHFDEAQHILRTKSKSEFDQVMLVWKSCLEYAEWPVSLILSGTCELLDLINRDDQLSRRFDPVHFMPMTFASHGHEVTAVLDAYLDAAELSRGKTLDNSTFVRRLLHAARYEFGSKIGLIISAIKLALRDGDQTLEQSHFAGAYRKQKRCVDALNPFIAENFRSIKTGQLLSGAELEIAPAIKRGAA
ncbi:MAG: TniB family NTP-binding protein [Mangrovicoccus sp.]|nr:TniB family NTP-binding protein [Mangrovicoccus sp.]